MLFLLSLIGATIVFAAADVEFLSARWSVILIGMVIFGIANSLGGRD